MKKIALILILVIVAMTALSCQSTNSKQVKTKHNWSNITITSKGEGAPPDNAENEAQARLLACRSAKMDAYRNLTEKIYGVKISGSSYISDFVVQNDKIRSSVQGFIKKAQVINETTKEDGACEVTLEIYLGKEFAEMIMKKLNEGEKR